MWFFFKHSPKRHVKFDRNIQRTRRENSISQLMKLCNTRWAARRPVLFPRAFPCIYGRRYDWRSSYSMSPCPSHHPLSVSLARVFPTCFRSSSSFSLIYPPSTLSSVCIIHPPPSHDMSSQVQSSLRDLSGSLKHSRCPSYVFVPDLVIACHSVYPP